MNYPFRKAILDFVRGNDDGSGFRRTVRTIVENYPAQVMACCMNLLGTHDTPRILTALVDPYDGPREVLAARKLSPQQLVQARERLMMASFLQYMLPGSPSIYYGDEVLMEGHKDPFNRRTYPWGKEDKELLGHFRMLGALRKAQPALQRGGITFFRADSGRLGFSRHMDGKILRIYVNAGMRDWELPGGQVLLGHNISRLTLKPMGFCVVQED